MAKKIAGFAVWLLSMPVLMNGIWTGRLLYASPMWAIYLLIVVTALTFFAMQFLAYWWFWQHLD